jgi:NAD(P)-dependent dehydrogenase (short-subunit alcohol dehydrogenase family)
MTITLYPSLAGRTVLVTGGASGIGACLVEHFVRQRAHVAFIDIDATSGNALALRLAHPAQPVPSADPDPLFIAGDLTLLDGIPALVAQVTARFGPIHVLVNNAANDDRHVSADVTPAYWQERLAINLHHHFFVTQAVVPGMTAAGGGAIINLGSMSWRIGMGGLPAYTTAKAGIEGLTRGLARELGPHRIRVNCIAPGAVLTPRQLERWWSPDTERMILERQSLKEILQPADIAHFAVFLASADARMCTGQTYIVDGGLA